MNAVLRCRDADEAPLRTLLSHYRMGLVIGPDAAPIPGSYWGDEEAGLVGDALHARAETPLHSVLHEACHYVCMTPARRGGLHTDAGGDYDEENAVCYLQILLAGELDGFGRNREWLLTRGLIDAAGRPTWTLNNDIDHKERIA